MSFLQRRRRPSKNAGLHRFLESSAYTSVTWKLICWKRKDVAQQSGLKKRPFLCSTFTSKILQVWHFLPNPLHQQQQNGVFSFCMLNKRLQKLITVLIGAQHQSFVFNRTTDRQTDSGSSSFWPVSQGFMKKTRGLLIYIHHANMWRREGWIWRQVITGNHNQTGGFVEVFLSVRREFVYEEHIIEVKWFLSL